MFNSAIKAVQINTVAPTMLFSSSSLRWGFWLFPGQGNSIWCSPQPGNLYATGNGFEWGSSASVTGAIFFNVRDHGSFVQDALYAIAKTGGPSIGIIEVMACDCESQALMKDALGHRSGDKAYHALESSLAANINAARRDLAKRTGA